MYVRLQSQGAPFAPPARVPQGEIISVSFFILPPIATCPPPPPLPPSQPSPPTSHFTLTSIKFSSFSYAAPLSLPCSRLASHILMSTQGRYCCNQVVRVYHLPERRFAYSIPPSPGPAIPVSPAADGLRCPVPQKSTAPLISRCTAVRLCPSASLGRLFVGFREPMRLQICPLSPPCRPPVLGSLVFWSGVPFRTFVLRFKYPRADSCGRFPSNPKLVVFSSPAPAGSGSAVSQSYDGTSV